jgi:tRNA-specific adenosine deaminase 3
VILVCWLSSVDQHFWLTSAWMSFYQVGNAAIIVDPSSMQIISKATDLIQQHDTSLEGNKCARVEADNTCLLPETTEDKAGSLLLSSSCFGLDKEVSCINPFGWMKQRSIEQKPLPSQDGFLWHPLRHAAVVAIENAAERDRILFPTSTIEPKLNGDVENCSDDEPAKRLKIVTEVSTVTYTYHFYYCRSPLITLLVL